MLAHVVESSSPKEEFQESSSEGSLVAHLQKMLQTTLDKQEKLEREKSNLERNLAQKAELYEDAMRMMHSIRMQHNEMIQAQFERICFLEGEIEPAQKDAQKGREIAESYVRKTAECKDLQDALEELEQEMKFAVAAARAETERKYEPEVKRLRDELQSLQDEYAIETAAFEKYHRETQTMIDEQHDIRAQLEYSRRANEIRAQLICFLEEHVDSAGMAKIKEASRKLKIAKRSIQLTSQVISPQGSFTPAPRTRSTDRERAQSRERPAAAAAAAAMEEEDGWSTSRSGHSSRPLSARATAADRSAAVASAAPSPRPAAADGGVAARMRVARAVSFSSSRGQPAGQDETLVAALAAAEPEPKFNFQIGPGSAPGPGERPGFSFERLVQQLRDARRQIGDLGERLEGERCTAESLARRVAELEALVPPVRRGSPASAATGGPDVPENAACGAAEVVALKDELAAARAALRALEIRVAEAGYQLAQAEAARQQAVAERSEEAGALRREMAAAVWEGLAARDKALVDLRAAEERLVPAAVGGQAGGAVARRLLQPAATAAYPARPSLSRSHGWRDAEQHQLCAGT